MKYRIGIVAAVAIAITLPLVAQGRQGQGGQGMRPGGRGGPGVLQVVRQLDLTDAQREQLRALTEEGRQKGEPDEQVRAAEQKLHAAILADSPDLQAIEALKTRLNTAHASELDRRIEMMQKVAQILTPAQRQQALKLEAQGPARGRGRERH